MKLLQKKQHKPARRSSTATHDGRSSRDDLDERYAFRRNRTLTGSLASGVASANEQRAELKSARVHAHHLKKRRRHVFASLCAVALLAGSLGWLIFQSIATVHVASNDTTLTAEDKSRYEQKIQHYFTQYPLERSRVTVDTTKMTLYLQDNECPEVLRVDPATSFAGFGASRITLHMRRPVVSWKSGETQLYVDSDGAAFRRNYFATPRVAVVDQTGIQAVNNQVLASNRFLGFIGRTIGKLTDQGYTTTKIVLPADTTRQLQVSVDGVGYPIKFNVDRSAGEQAEDAARAIRHLAAKGITPEYLDVRVSGRAYYK